LRLRNYLRQSFHCPHHGIQRRGGRPSPPYRPVQEELESRCVPPAA